MAVRIWKFTVALKIILRGYKHPQRSINSKTGVVTIHTFPLSFIRYWHVQISFNFTLPWYRFWMLLELTGTWETNLCVAKWISVPDLISQQFLNVTGKKWPQKPTVTRCYKLFGDVNFAIRSWIHYIYIWPLMYKH